MSQTESTIELLRDFLKKRAGVAPEAVTPEAALAEVKIDSLMLLELVFECEEKWGVNFPSDFATPANVGELIELVDRVRAQTPSEPGN
ncbi:MAG: acyl carrier protein [Betaproteobacteria bacterium]|nr:acyl carrier protein [Betaproteobacteria bacterium]